MKTRKPLLLLSVKQIVTNTGKLRSFHGMHLKNEDETNYLLVGMEQVVCSSEVLSVGKCSTQS